MSTALDIKLYQVIFTLGDKYACHNRSLVSLSGMSRYQRLTLDFSCQVTGLVGQRLAGKSTLLMNLSVCCARSRGRCCGRERR